MVRTVTWGAFVQMRQRGERVRETPESFIFVSTEIVGVLNHWSKINLALVNSVWSMERPVFQFGHFLTGSPGLPDISPWLGDTMGPQIFASSWGNFFDRGKCVNH